MPACRTCRPHAPLLAILAAVVGLLGGCAGGSSRPPAPVSTSPIADSHLSFDRTFDLARAALSDQKLAIEQQDRRAGVIVGTEGAIAVTATLEQIREGPIRVTFRQVPEGADPALLQRVITAYHTRMSKFGVLGGEKGWGAGAADTGPVPCPSGPAFCP